MLNLHAFSVQILTVLLCFSQFISAETPQPARNLALGKKVMYSISPDSPEDNVEASKLTDGKNGMSIDDKENIVGWSGKAEQISTSQGIYICIDLGKEYNLDAVSIRMFSATPKCFRFRLPKLVTAAVSQDGKDFYKVDTVAKVTTYGTSIPAGARAFHVKERSNKTYDFNFNLDGIKARYVGFHVIGEGFMFYADECKIFESTNAHPEKVEAKIYNPKNRYPFFIGQGLSPDDKIFFGPCKDMFVVSRNINTPNMLLFSDYCAEKGSPYRRMTMTANPVSLDNLEFIIELPDGVNLVPTPRTRANTIIQSEFMQDGKKRTRFSIKLNAAENQPGWVARDHHYGRLLVSHRFGPLYFSTDKKFDGKESATFYCVKNGQAQYKRTVPFYSIDIPQVEPLKDIHTSLTWMFEPYAMDWPDFIRSYKHMGFNAISTWPSHYITEQGELPQELKKFLDAARNAGLKITMNTSPLHGISGEDSACIDVEPKFLCPTYTGKLYHENMQRIAEDYKLSKPDYIFFDSEVFWCPLAERVQKCPRCQKAIKESGLSPQEYLLKCGTRAIKDIVTAAGRKDGKGPVIGFYHVDAGKESFQDFLSFARVYPKYIDIAMPEYYAAGILDYLHSQARTEYTKIGKPWHFITWLSAGTFGEFPSFKLEPMIYEQVLNGGGIAFFCFQDFDTPMDFYYFAKAMATLSKYQGLLATGHPAIDWKGNNPYLDYTAFVGENECLLLLGNYWSDKNERAACPLPLKGEVSVKELTGSQNAWEIIAGNIVVSVPPQGVRLFHVVTKPSNNK